MKTLLNCSRAHLISLVFFSVWSGKYKRDFLLRSSLHLQPDAPFAGYDNLQRSVFIWISSQVEVGRYTKPMYGRSTWNDFHSPNWMWTPNTWQRRQQRVDFRFRGFNSRDCASVTYTYVRSIAEYNSIGWNPCASWSILNWKCSTQLSLRSHRR